MACIQNEAGDSVAVKITLENFFDIDSEEFELSSFMVFCGDNSSGKTHLVKLLSTVDHVLRDTQGASKVFSFRSSMFESSELQLLQECLQYDSEKQHGEFLIQNDKKEKIYDMIEKYVDTLFHENKEKIFVSAFPDSIIQKLGKLKFRFTDRHDIRILIKRLNTFDHVSIDEEIRVQYRLEVKINDNTLFGALSSTKDEPVADMLKRLLPGNFIFMTLLAYKINFPSGSADMLYLPASREAYTRDYDYFLSTGDLFLENGFEIKETELYANDSKRNNHSDDPFVERYVQQFISSFKWDKSNNNQKIVDFLENNILKAKVMFNEGKLRYKLENDQEISTIQASSMQNEYSFFARLIQTDRYKSLVIEEPEAHLSLPNAIRFTFVLLALHQKGYNIWITTHNTFIADTINNFILMSKLEQEKQLQFLKQFQIDSMLTHIEPQRVDEINALYIKKEGIHYLEKNNQGIIFKQFIKQINQFVDLTAELQNEFWEDDDE